MWWRLSAWSPLSNRYPPAARTPLRRLRVEGMPMTSLARSAILGTSGVRMGRRSLVRTSRTRGVPQREASCSTRSRGRCHRAVRDRFAMRRTSTSSRTSCRSMGMHPGRKPCALIRRWRSVPVPTGSLARSSRRKTNGMQRVVAVTPPSQSPARDRFDWSVGRSRPSRW